MLISVERRCKYINIEKHWAQEIPNIVEIVVNIMHVKLVIAAEGSTPNLDMKVLQSSLDPVFRADLCCRDRDLVSVHI
jgi:hypothetical protein